MPKNFSTETCLCCLYWRKSLKPALSIVNQAVDSIIQDVLCSKCRFNY